MKIGVTGGMGSGKSFVVSQFEKLGAIVYSADERAKELVYQSQIKSQIIDLLGEDSFKDEQYNTKFVASKVFKDKNLLEALNDIIHPAVFEDLDMFCKKNEGKTIIYESALMIETSHCHLFDKVILVTAPKEIRIQRVMERDHIDRKSVENRMKNQWSYEEKLPFADFVIENLDKESTIAIVERMWINNFT